jgi:hypothetical protein
MCDRQQLLAQLAHATEIEAIWRVRELASFEKLTKITALLEALTNTSADADRDVVLSRVEGEYHAAQQKVRDIVARGQRLLSEAQALAVQVFFYFLFS